MPTQIDRQDLEPRMLFAAAGFEGARVLEIGSGNGRLSFLLAAKARQIFGIDPKHDDLRAALTSCPEALRQKVRFARASSVTLPFRDAEFDIAVFAHAL